MGTFIIYLLLFQKKKKKKKMEDDPLILFKKCIQNNRPVALLKESKQIDFDGVKVPMDKTTSLKQGKGKPYNIAAIWFLYQNKNSNYATYSKLATAEGFTRVRKIKQKKKCKNKK